MTHMLMPQPEFYNDWREWAAKLLKELEAENEVTVKFKTYTVATLPSAKRGERTIIYVSDEAGGATLAFSDGTDWRRVQDRAVVS